MSIKSNDKGGNARTHVAPVAVPAELARQSRRLNRVSEHLHERQGALPVWIRSPKSGTEYFTGASRAKLYEWAGKGYIRSTSIREPGQLKGTRLFLLSSILAFIERNAEEQKAGGE